jgi:hypothetical protein
MTLTSEAGEKRRSCGYSTINEKAKMLKCTVPERGADDVLSGTLLLEPI